ncbi:MAG: DUF4276 family protein [Bryobacteraceae bacterium]
MNTECRRAFAAFFEKAGLRNRMPRIIAGGGRTQAREDFRRVLRSGENALLLIDSEGPVPDGTDPWTVLASEGWRRPERATGDHVHLMVECMEAWFLADRNALSSYFGKGFRENALPGNPRPNQVAKAEILRAVDIAARDTTKQGYDKGRDSFRILALVDPSRVRASCPWVRRLLEKLAV